MPPRLACELTPTKRRIEAELGVVLDLLAGVRGETKLNGYPMDLAFPSRDR
jgi:hypothetical protein